MKKNYLENYFEENNGVKERLTINKQLLIRIIGFIILSCIYLIIKALPSHNLEGDISTISSLDFYDTIMNLTFLIAVVGIIFLFINHFKPLQIKFKVKKIIFNILDWLIILPICVCLSTVVFNYFFTFAEVSGDSMLPTINNKDQLVLFYDKDYERDDIVVIDVQREHNLNIIQNKYYIKRLVGLPNDTMKIIKNNDKIEIYINDSLYNQDYYQNNSEVFDYTYFNIDKYTIENNLGIYIEGDGRVLFTYIDDNGNIERTYTIPEGYCFVMGDNRSNSKDSREIGLVRLEDVFGIIKYRVENNFILNWGEVE